MTKHGNPRLRAALVELPWRRVRFQPQYPPVYKRLPVLAKGARATGAARKKAIVCSPLLLPPLVPCAAASAVARQLSVNL